MDDDDPDFKLPPETGLIASTLFCFALFASLAIAPSEAPPPPSAIAYPIDASRTSQSP